MTRPPALDQTSSHSSSSAVAVAGNAKVLASPAVLSVPTRCVVVMAPNALADALFCLPALAGVRESFPGAHVSCVARASLAPLIRLSHLVDEVLERPRGGLSAQAHLLLRLHALRPDIALAFSPGRNAVLLAWSSGAPVRAGFEEAKMEALLTHRVPRNGPPRIEAFLELARSLGCKTPHLDYCGLLEAGPGELQSAQDLLDAAGVAGRFVLVAPSPPEPRSRRSSGESRLDWEEVLPALAESWPVVVVGPSPSPRLMRACLGRPAFDFGGRADLPALAALCLKSSLFVGPEGGLLHLASAMQTPVVGLYPAQSNGSSLPRGPRRIVRVEDENSPHTVRNSVLSAAREMLGLGTTQAPR